MVRTLYAPSGQAFKLGRKRAVARCPHFKLHHYLTNLPMPPTSCNYGNAAAPALARVYLNDQLGDCVIAGMQHVEGVLTANASPTAGPALFSDLNTQWLYECIGGYNPDDPSTDGGCDEQTALNFWQTKGLEPNGNGKIAAWIAVDGTNAIETSLALWLFENLIFGVELPEDWITPFPSRPGFLWDVAGPPEASNGHCFIAYGYDPGYKRISTWGMTGILTDAAIAKYAVPSVYGQVYAVLSMDAIDKASLKAPNGFDWDQLRADMLAMS